MNRSLPRHRRGFSLVEATISSLIVGTMVVASLALIGSTARSQTVHAHREVALALAHELMAEIVHTRYAEPDPVPTPIFGPETNESNTPMTRQNFDDVDDFHGWTSSPPQDGAGTELLNFAAYERRVNVEYVSPLDPGGSGSTSDLSNVGLKRITVTVTSEGAAATLTALRSIYSSYDVKPAVEGTYVRTVGITLQLGENGTAMESSVPVMNQMPLGAAP
jgi:hypothetical protein